MAPSVFFYLAFTILWFHSSNKPTGAWQPSPPFLSRREVLVSSGSIAFLLDAPSGIRPPASTALAADPPPEAVVTSLLSLIPPMAFGAPATNATLPLELSSQIETVAKQLESVGSMRNTATSPLLSGNWRLLYSNAPEITSLAANLPLGFCLGKTFQPLDTTAGFFENRGNIEHTAGLAKLKTTVVGDVRVAQAGSLNAVGVVNDQGNRVNVDFRVITFELEELLGRPVHFQKTLTPKVDPEKTVQPANDITYLDQTLRIVRGGDGSLFVFVREYMSSSDNSSTPMLTVAEREALFGNQAKGAAEVAVGVGAAEQSSSPELQFLFRGRK